MIPVREDKSKRREFDASDYTHIYRTYETPRENVNQAISDSFTRGAFMDDETAPNGARVVDVQRINVPDNVLATLVVHCTRIRRE